MSHDTSHETGHETGQNEPRSIDPGRFQQPTALDGATSRDKFGAGFALFALVVLVPAVLFLLKAPPPIPHSLPDRHSLTQPLSFDALLTFLVAVVWLAWLFFVVCVIFEIVAARRGGMSKPVPLGGPVQKFARLLVGALMLAEVVSGPASAAMASEAPAPHTSSVVTQGSVAAGAAVAVDAESISEAAAQAAAPQQVTEQSHLAGHKVYVVAAPVNGYHDNLWDIATRHLGDGRRYKEIYELNKGLLQQDGRKLELARLIQPGWNLVMPADATGVERLGAPASTPANGGSDAPIATAPAVGLSNATQATSTAHDDGGVLPGGLAGTGLLAATALAALAFERRRRIGIASSAGDVEVALRGSATPSRAEFLDRALRDLATSCREASTPLPPVYAVTLDDQSVRLELAPAVTTSVGSWTAAEDGRSWSREFFPEGAAPSGEIAPYPGLVSLGVDDRGSDVLVDLESAGGVVALDGDPTVASEVAAAIALQAGTAPWAETMRVTATGLPAGLDEIGDNRIRVLTDLSPALDEFEADLDVIRTDVLTGRVTRRGATPTRLVVAGAALDDATTDRLVDLTGPERQALSVVISGPQPSARWTIRVDHDGHLTLGELGISVTANRIGPAEVEGVAALFEAARQPDRPDDGSRVSIPKPARLVDDAAWSTAPRRIGVLGPVAVTGVGDADAARLEQLTEMVVYLALHPEGVHPKVLAGALWPRGVTQDVSDAAVDRAREWLGDDVHGHSYLREGADGRLSLGENAVCDWDAARSLLVRSRTASTRGQETELLRRALQLVRGDAFTGIPEGRYSWVAHDDLERTVRRVFVDAAHRLVEIAEEDNDPTGGAAAAQAGLRIDPANQLLWRDLLRARHEGNGVAGVRQTLDAMGEPLRGIPLEAETEALVEEYLPDQGGALTAG